MGNILVICGAGASSTFLVHWMRREASSRGLDLEIHAGSDAELDSRLSASSRMTRVDVVLVGQHLAGSFPALSLRSDAAGVPSALLPALAFDASGATVALDLAIATSPSLQHPTIHAESGRSNG